MTAAPTSALEDLLHELFDDDELARFLARHYPEVHDKLPPRASTAVRRSAAAGALARHCGDAPGLFQTLRAERPLREVRIDEVERACARRPAAAPPPRAHVRRILMVSFVLGGALFAWQVHDRLTTRESTAPRTRPSVTPMSSPDPVPPAVAEAAAVPPAPQPTAPHLACGDDAVLIAAPFTSEPFCIDRSEVSRRQFGLRCEGKTEYHHQRRLSSRRLFCRQPPADPDDHPATGMSPREAVAHCASLGKRLVGEREWRSAVTAVLGGREPELLVRFVNVCGKECPQYGDSDKYTHSDAYPWTAPVGLLALPSWGEPAIHDLFGNVHEIIITTAGFRACGGGWDSTYRGSLDPQRCLDPRNPVLPPDATTSYEGRGFRCVAEPRVLAI